MNHYLYKGKMHSIKQLAEASGIKEHTLRDRLRRGYSVEEAVSWSPVADSVRAFNDSSWHGDWVGKPIAEVYDIYWKWCISNGYMPEAKQGFSRHLMSMNPQLKVSPTKINRNLTSCQRVIQYRKNIEW